MPILCIQLSDHQPWQLPWQYIYIKIYIEISCDFTIVTAKYSEGGGHITGMSLLPLHKTLS